MMMTVLTMKLIVMIMMSVYDDEGDDDDDGDDDLCETELSLLCMAMKAWMCQALLVFLREPDLVMVPCCCLDAHLRGCVAEG